MNILQKLGDEVSKFYEVNGVIQKGDNLISKLDLYDDPRAQLLKSTHQAVLRSSYSQFLTNVEVGEFICTFYTYLSSIDNLDSDFLRV